MSAAHTPGPWTAAVPPSSCLTTRFVVGPNDEHICKVGHMDYTAGSQAADLANARLIAAAPDLAEALLNTLEILQWLQDSGNIKSPVTPHPYGMGVIMAKQQARAALARLKEPVTA